MSVKTQSSQTGEASALSGASTPDILEKPDDAFSHTPSVVGSQQKEEMGAAVENASENKSSTGRFTLLMTVTALAMSMFLVRISRVPLSWAYEANF